MASQRIRLATSAAAAAAFGAAAVAATSATAGNSTARLSSSSPSSSASQGSHENVDKVVHSRPVCVNPLTTKTAKCSSRTIEQEGTVVPSTLASNGHSTDVSDNELIAISGNTTELSPSNSQQMIQFKLPPENTTFLENLSVVKVRNIVEEEIHNFHSHVESKLHDTKIRAMVTRRFMDLLYRSAVTIIDYKVHSYLHQYQQEEKTAVSYPEKPNESLTHTMAEKDDSDMNKNDASNDTSPRDVRPVVETTTTTATPFSNDNNNTDYLNAVHERAAKSMYEACAIHGGLLIKLGQFISINMNGFIPKVYIETLSPLQDECSPLDIGVVKEIIMDELWTLKHSTMNGGDVDDNNNHQSGKSNSGNKRRTEGEGEKLLKEVFVQIDSKPLGSASLAQVHSATLNDGRGTKVAVKVQRPNLDLTTKADLAALSILSKVVEYFFPGAGFEWMLPEFHTSIAAELDFTQEAINAGRCQAMLRGCSLDTTDKSTLWNVLFRPWLKSRRHTLDGGSTTASGPPKAVVPTPLSNLTTSKMLTMTFEEGFKITDKEKLKKYNIDPKKVAAATCALFAELVHVHGFVHADPHPGNILVRPRKHAKANRGVMWRAAGGEFDIVLLDHGMYRRLNENFRSNYAKLWAGLVSGNNNLALSGVRGLGMPDSYLDILGLMLVYRLPSGLQDKTSPLGLHKLGNVMGKTSRAELKKRMKEKFGDSVFSVSSINTFWESQPRDLLFCIRCMALVRGINRELGGTTLDRFVAFGTAASRGSKIGTGVSVAEADFMTSVPNDSALAVAKSSLNRPVVSEVLAQSRWRSDQASQIRNEYQMMVPKTVFDLFDSYKISFHVWFQSLFMDLLLYLSGNKFDVSPMQLG